MKSYNLFQLLKSFKECTILEDNMASHLTEHIKSKLRVQSRFEIGAIELKSYLKTEFKLTDDITNKQMSKILDCIRRNLYTSNICTLYDAYGLVCGKKL